MSIVRDLPPLFGAAVWFQLQLEINISSLLTEAMPSFQTADYHRENIKHLSHKLTMTVKTITYRDICSTYKRRYTCLYSSAYNCLAFLVWVVRIKTYLHLCSQYLSDCNYLTRLSLELTISKGISPFRD